ncbi:hypothetical protein DFH06DRAFT_1123544 [Mycena polygramma]|nr:hypothetical protein DFH06DRAFT_1123544 [Mycena polygramma]
MSSPRPENIGSSVLVPAYPFNNSPVADAILRSRDGADFYILRGILSLLSPFFATMFRLPQPEATQDIPVVDMGEDAATLNKILRFIYPGTEPIVESIDDLRIIIELVIAKYDMQCEVPKVKRYLKGYCSTHYLGVYTLASTYGWKDIAIAAAKKSLKHPIRTIAAPAPSALAGLTAIAYHDLIHYHYLCGRAAQRTTVDLGWAYTPFNDDCRQRPCHPWASSTMGFATGLWNLVPEWFPGYINDIGHVLLETPGANIRQSPVYDVALAQGQCTSCNSFTRFRKWATVDLPARLEAEIAKVRRYAAPGLARRS